MTSYNNLHRFILFTACCTFLLIIAGGLVTSTQSGLSVPDWPNTYGHFMFAFPLDQMVGGIFYEHSHRMIASTVGFLTIIVAVWLQKREDRKWIRTLGWIALAVVVTQGILGGFTVKFLLPTSISVSHATLAQTFFSLMAALALFTSPWWRTEKPLLRDTQKISLLQISLLTTTAVFVQLILGAIMRHVQAGTAVPDFPLAYGQLVPSLTPEAMARYNQQLIDSNIRLFADDPVSSNQIIVHMLHRIWAIVVAVMICWTSARLMRSSVQRLSLLGYLLLALLGIQLTLGALTVLSVKAVDVTTAHVATGSLILVTCVLVSLHAVKLFGLHAQHPAVSLTPREATV